MKFNFRKDWILLPVQWLAIRLILMKGCFGRSKTHRQLISLLQKLENFGLQIFGLNCSPGLQDAKDRSPSIYQDDMRLFSRLNWVSLRSFQRFGILLLLLPLLLLSSCSLPQVKPEDRLFLNLSLGYLGAYQLPKQDFEGTRIGGLSGITYDRQRNQFYALSDDRSNFGPARFYTLKLSFEDKDGTPSIGQVSFEKVTTLIGENGEPFPADSIDPEGIALSPNQSLFISTEGDRERGIDPFIAEFDLETGRWRNGLPLPKRYLLGVEKDQQGQDQPVGVQNNQGFESLTLNAASYGSSQLEPFRLFAATEGPLLQDLAPGQPSSNLPIRMMHYLIGDQPVLLAEHLYSIDPPGETDENLGLSDLLVLDQGGHFLSLERAFGLTGFSVKIFQLAIGGATDVAPIPRLEGYTEGITPIYKRLLLDLTTLGIPLDNYEGMVVGPQLPDGSTSLILVSDDNFNELQTTEFLLFRLRQG